MSFQWSSSWFFIAVTLIGPVPTLIESSVISILFGNLPWMLSNLSKCAFVFTGPKSFIAITEISVRLFSTMALSTFRPIRPNPLIATRTVTVYSFKMID